VQIGPGILVYVSFMKGASEELLEKCVQTILNAKICFHENWKKNYSVLNTRGDVLVIPQASLAGKMKGKQMQYHSLIDKEEGANLYKKFVEIIEENLKWHNAVDSNDRSSESIVGSTKTVTSLKIQDDTPKAESEVRILDDLKERCSTLKFGTYGNRQGLYFESFGPFTHLLEW